MNPGVETNLMVTFWENFSVFPADVWVPALADACGLSQRIGTVVDCAWSYGWRSERAKRIIDILVHYRSANGASGFLVVEAKRPGGRLADKDLTPETYLDVPELVESSPRRSLLYLVDDADAPKIREACDGADDRWSVLTWQKLGGLQIRLIERLALVEPLRSFVAGALQYQYAQHGIRPSKLAAPYLETEPPMEAVDAQAGGTGLKDFPPTAELWRFGER